jgi:hypothetical protein
MADPISLALIGTTVLTEGIKFLYGQASKILERRAARKETAEKEAASAASTPKTEPTQVQLPAIFQGQLRSPEIDFDEVERQYKALLLLRGKLVNYADGAIDVDPNDNDLMADVDALRQLLESVYGQKITFKGERREASGTKVTTRVNIREVQGKLIVTKVGEAQGGEINTEFKSDLVGPDADVVVTDLGRMKSK